MQTMLFREWDTADESTESPVGDRWIRGATQEVSVRGETGFAVPWWWREGSDGPWGSDAVLLGVGGFEVARGVSDVRAVLGV